MSDESPATSSPKSGKGAESEHTHLDRPANMEEFAPGFGAEDNMTPAPAEEEKPTQE